MKKLLHGIVEFRTKCLQDYIDKFSHLAERQSPDILLITCSDSRVAPNVFASTNPGDVFVLRNMGNIIPAFTETDEHIPSSEAAAIYFSLENLPIKDIIICGHSDCGAMHAVLKGIESIEPLSIKSWLFSCGCKKEELSQCSFTNKELLLHNQLSQMNVLKQMDHLKTYPIIQKRLQEGTLNIHGWYFDLAKGDVYNFEQGLNRFVLIDEEEALNILERLK